MHSTYNFSGKCLATEGVSQTVRIFLRKITLCSWTFDSKSSLDISGYIVFSDGSAISLKNACYAKIKTYLSHGLCDVSEELSQKVEEIFSTHQLGVGFPFTFQIIISTCSIITAIIAFSIPESNLAIRLVSTFLLRFAVCVIIHAVSVITLLITNTITKHIPTLNIGHSTVHPWIYTKGAISAIPVTLSNIALFPASFAIKSIRAIVIWALSLNGNFVLTMKACVSI